MTAPLTRVLQAGLRWMYDTEQPDGAVAGHRGVPLAADGNRTVHFIPASDREQPCIVVEVTDITWLQVNRWTREPGNPLAGDELPRLTAELRALGAEVTDTWESLRGVAGLLWLARAAHPTLLAATARYRAGCLEHHLADGSGDPLCPCGWFQRGQALLIPPTVQEP